MDMNKRFYFLVVATVIAAVAITLLLRKSSNGYEKLEASLPSAISFPLNNVVNDGFSLTQGKRGKGIGSKDINGRRQQEEDERQRQFFSSTKQAKQYPDVELPLTSNPRTEKTRWHHRGSRQTRTMFTKATVNTNEFSFEQDDVTWFRNVLAFLGKILGSSLHRDASLNFARQLYFR